MTRIKICGNREADGIAEAVALGVDMLGFIFTPSPRQVGVEVAAALVERLPATMETVGVFVDEPPPVIGSVLERCPMRAIQLYRPATLADHALGVPIIQVLRMPNDLDALGRQPPGGRVLLDTWRADFGGGGSGRPWDWNRLRSAVPDGVRVIASGGLHSENVAEAIATLGPWGVDVASGVEQGPGRKDLEKLRRFVQAVRSADAARSLPA